jgi:hypothetical protein
MMMRRLIRPFLVLLALVFLFEAWLWEKLAPVVAWIVARIPWAAFKARVAAAIEQLPPYPTLLVFLVPVILLLPLKFVGLWMLAHGFWIGSLGVLAFAKMMSLGVTAFNLRRDAAEAVAASVVPLALRARARVARLGARPCRSDQAAPHDLLPGVRAKAREPYAQASHPNPSPHADGALAGVIAAGTAT